MSGPWSSCAPCCVGCAPTSSTPTTPSLASTGAWRGRQPACPASSTPCTVFTPCPRTLGPSGRWCTGWSGWRFVLVRRAGAEPRDIDVLVRLGVARAKLRLLGNGIDLARFDRAAVPAEQVRRLRAEIGARPEDVVCGAVGRLVWEKGYAELFEAAAALRRRLPQARFVVVGPLDPDKADGLSDVDLARSRERAGITFLGLRHDVAELYAAMDLYVLASHREGYPPSAMERPLWDCPWWPPTSGGVARWSTTAPPAAGAAWGRAGAGRRGGHLGGRFRPAGPHRAGGKPEGTPGLRPAAGDRHHPRDLPPAPGLPASPSSGNRTSLSVAGPP